MLRPKAVILAGGQGTRFWPISRMKKPKQFLSLTRSGNSLIGETVRRIEPLCGSENIWVATGDDQTALVKEHVPSAHVISEPCARNTAASLGLAAAYIDKVDPNAVLVCLPSDHAVKDEIALRKVLQDAAELANSQDLLVTIGIRPTHAHTGYGYILRGAPLVSGGFTVRRFYEKPNQERANEYYESGNYFWNSGMFVWKARVLLQEIEEYMPAMYSALMAIQDAIGTPEEQEVLKEQFVSMEAISIDFGVLEHARNCAVIPADSFGWNDVGSWDAWAEYFNTDSKNNLVEGDALVLDSRDCIVKSAQRFIAVLGLDDVVVIDSGDALLICPRDRVQDVRKVVQHLKENGRNELI
ncbi:MAG: NTP transferase domain-containing protein [SAR324 cluster bacterium]|uniref:mannose-1-phosphate guanylyltransferase n=1 Tax=SAR324 cluster bacterium TaxID=2024889 RepID=A0A7X9FR27_9DELT|nr:NTP transferase domain-containing protein [SAR324 cluster bacterium]